MEIRWDSSSWRACLISYIYVKNPGHKQQPKGWSDFHAKDKKQRVNISPRKHWQLNFKPGQWLGTLTIFLGDFCSNTKPKWVSRPNGKSMMPGHRSSDAIWDHFLGSLWPSHTDFFETYFYFFLCKDDWKSNSNILEIKYKKLNIILSAWKTHQIPYGDHWRLTMEKPKL